MDELLRVDADDWRAELPLIESHFSGLGGRVPAELTDELAKLEKRLG
jgi:phosphoenolpyruvate carboxykinase (GTP)